MRMLQSVVGAARAGAAGAWLALAVAGAHAQAAPDAALVEQGHRLAVAADCAACHTAPKGGPAYAGGYPIDSPLGTIWSSNITPSKATGIGDYSLDDFRRALRQGVRKDGAHLYPAMPYTAYTRLTDADTAALYAYFMHGVAPVEKATPATTLPFPFGIRASMAAWNALYLDDRRFVPDPSKSAQVNRGAYLGEALEHCTTCHTPRNALMAERGNDALAGGRVGVWYAPNITSDATAGIGAWRQDELVQYLRTGHMAGKAQAAGPMAEAVEHSLQYLPIADIEALAAWLKQMPARHVDEDKPRFAYGSPASSELEQRGRGATADAGWQVFSGNCSQCHQPDGAGNARYPSLFHNSATGGVNADNLVATILHGVDRTVDGVPRFMPAFGDAAPFTDRLSDAQVAAVSNYVLAQFGNGALHVTADDVRLQRAGGAPPLIARARPWGLALAAIVVLAIVVAFIRRGRRA